MMKYFHIVLLIVLSAVVASCSATSDSVKKDGDISWYLSPINNDAQNIYGVGEGYTLEEATKSALSDASAKLSVTISSNSSTLLEENRTDANVEFRKQINQNIEKIEFPAFNVDRSTTNDQTIYVQVSINRNEFVNLQKEKIEFLDNQVNNLKADIEQQNIIKKRNSYSKIIELAGQSEILTRIIYPPSEGKLKAKLRVISDAKNKLSKLNNKFEFFFVKKGDAQIYNVIKKYLNKAGVVIANVKSNDPNQIVMDIASNHSTGKVYNSYVTKIKVNFKNIAQNKTVASNDVETSGSSVIGRNESYNAAIKSLDREIKREGIFNILGLE